jgi:hypothetical protein
MSDKKPLIEFPDSSGIVNEVNPASLTTVTNESNQENKPKMDKSITALDLIKKLKEKRQYEEVYLPSRCLVYEDIGLSIDKPIHVRPMTIAEEKVLATPRLVKSGQAIDKIFESCIHENVNPDKLLSVDRTFLLFYIRGISYGSGYEVTLKCPACSQQFDEEINLDSLRVDKAPDGYNDDIHVVLPESELNAWYRLPRGVDEKNLNVHRKQMAKGFGNQILDDTIVRRNIILVNKIEHFTERVEIEQIINNLGVKDSNYLRDQISNPSFGIDTNIGLTCPYCFNEWEMDLPIDVNFFFPKTKKQS